jgi:hypothetical protein
MRKAILYNFSITIMYGCGSNDRGELVGVKIKTNGLVKNLLEWYPFQQVHLQWVNKTKI